MSQRPGTPFDNPMGSMMDMIRGNPTTPLVKGGPKDTLGNAMEQGQAIGKGIRMAGEALRTAFGEDHIAVVRLHVFIKQKRAHVRGSDTSTRELL